MWVEARAFPFLSRGNKNPRNTSSSQIGISIHNAQLYGQVKRQAEQLERIAELSRLINGTFDRRRIFQIIKDGIHKLIQTDLVAVALRSPDASLRSE